MILVTGTRRSGTSLWMQVLQAAGFSVIGEAFPKRWSETLRDANPEGFWESNLRHGIHYLTNPDPHSGLYAFPEQVQRHVAKVFIPGLVMSDRSHIDRVIATVRPWREYETSVARLYALEDAGLTRAGAPIPPRMPPALEWWDENYRLVRDIGLRRYPCHVQSFDGLLGEPAKVIERTLDWLGDGDRDAAIAVVKPEHRTAQGGDSSAVREEHARVFDDFYSAVHEWRELDGPLLERMQQCHEALAPEIDRERARIAEAGIAVGHGPFAPLMRP